MTWLDLVCVVLLVLAGIGGYEQGFIRGIARLLALLLGGALGALTIARLDLLNTASGAIGWAIAIAVIALAAMGMLIWSMGRAVPSFIHQAPANRVLGVLPALFLGLVILTLLLGLAERLALSPATQSFIRSGGLTGPLVGAVDLIEQSIAGVR